MIFDDKNLFRFDEPEYVDGLTKEQNEALRETEESSKIDFLIPAEIKNNKDKQIYKVGFLSEFLKRLYPEKNYSEICSIMSKRYHIFISRRQIDRIVKRFQEDSEK